MKIAPYVSFPASARDTAAARQWRRAALQLPFHDDAFAGLRPCSTIHSSPVRFPVTMGAFAPCCRRPRCTRLHTLDLLDASAESRWRPCVHPPARVCGRTGRAAECGGGWGSWPGVPACRLRSTWLSMSVTRLSPGNSEPSASMSVSCPAAVAARAGPGDVFRFGDLEADPHRIERTMSRAAAPRWRHQPAHGPANRRCVRRWAPRMVPYSRFSSAVCSAPWFEPTRPSWKHLVR